ncbi:hypothetical protein BH11BAC1_BH11BAC1_05120 [soil metagenome]
MEMETLNKGNVTLEGQNFAFETFVLKKSSKLNGLWRMLRIHDMKGNEVVTLYNVLKDNLMNIIIKSLKDTKVLNNL